MILQLLVDLEGLFMVIYATVSGRSNDKLIFSPYSWLWELPFPTVHRELKDVRLMTTGHQGHATQTSLYESQDDSYF